MRRERGIKKKKKQVYKGGSIEGTDKIKAHLRGPMEI